MEEINKEELIEKISELSACYAAENYEKGYDDTAFSEGVFSAIFTVLEIIKGM